MKGWLYMAREHVPVYHSYLEELAGYSDAEFGRLIRAMLRYSRDGVETPLKRKEMLFWPILRGSVDRCCRHYEEVSRKRSEAASRRYAKEHADEKALYGQRSWEDPLRTGFDPSFRR